MREALRQAPTEPAREIFRVVGGATRTVILDRSTIDNQAARRAFEDLLSLPLPRVAPGGAYESYWIELAEVGRTIDAADSSDTLARALEEEAKAPAEADLVEAGIALLHRYYDAGTWPEFEELRTRLLELAAILPPAEGVFDWLRPGSRKRLELEIHNLVRMREREEQSRKLDEKLRKLDEKLSGDFDRMSESFAKFDRTVAGLAIGPRLQTLHALLERLLAQDDDKITLATLQRLERIKQHLPAEPDWETQLASMMAAMLKDAATQENSDDRGLMLVTAWILLSSKERVSMELARLITAGELPSR